MRIVFVIGGCYVGGMKNSTLVGGEIFEFSPVEGLTTDIEHMSHTEVQQVVLVAKKLRDMADTQLLIATAAMHKMDSESHRRSDNTWLVTQVLSHVGIESIGHPQNRKSARTHGHRHKTCRYRRDHHRRSPTARHGQGSPSRRLRGARRRVRRHRDVLGPADLRRAINHWSQQVDHRSALTDTQNRRERRGVYLRHTLTGMWDLKGTLDPESGHTISTAITSITDPTLIDADDHRSHPQRRSDAITDICRFWLDHNQTVTTSGGNKPHITVTVDYDALVRGTDPAGLSQRSTAHPETMRRLTCNAGIVRIVADGTGQPLDVGRRVRTAPPAIRRALEHRDGGCTWTGCTAPVSWCDAHHIIHWADGAKPPSPTWP
ncbi:MAG: hypothetical protein BMS9Abin17_0367 [Acidimicrobiia bacterium]|nr:MAG: hypothetical protein BMS9Abin17_0367 [Acidimicrobiia bacterium]